MPGFLVPGTIERIRPPVVKGKVVKKVFGECDEQGGACVSRSWHWKDPQAGPSEYPLQHLEDKETGVQEQHAGFHTNLAIRFKHILRLGSIADLEKKTEALAKISPEGETLPMQALHRSAWARQISGQVVVPVEGGQVVVPVEGGHKRGKAGRLWSLSKLAVEDLGGKAPPPEAE